MSGSHNFSRHQHLLQHREPSCEVPGTPVRDLFLQQQFMFIVYNQITHLLFVEYSTMLWQ